VHAHRSIQKIGGSKIDGLFRLVKNLSSRGPFDDGGNNEMNFIEQIITDILSRASAEVKLNIIATEKRPARNAVKVI